MNSFVSFIKAFLRLMILRFKKCIDKFQAQDFFKNTILTADLINTIYVLFFSYLYSLQTVNHKDSKPSSISSTNGVDFSVYSLLKNFLIAFMSYLQTSGSLCFVNIASLMINNLSGFIWFSAWYTFSSFVKSLFLFVF